jgi:hypothetical protein
MAIVPGEQSQPRSRPAADTVRDVDSSHGRRVAMVRAVLTEEGEGTSGYGLLLLLLPWCFSATVSRCQRSVLLSRATLHCCCGVTLCGVRPHHLA